MNTNINHTLNPISIDDLTAFAPAPTPPPTHKQLQRDCGYYKAQQLVEAMFDCGLISLSEFNNITALNRKTFSPYLAEIMPNMT